MNKKLQLSEINQLIGKNYSMIQLGNELNLLTKNIGLFFIEPQVGSGYLLWTLPETDWKSFNEFDDANKPIVASIYKELCDNVREILKNSPITESILTVPSNDFVYFHKNGDKWEVALAAWGCKLVDVPVGNDIETWIKHNDTQIVNIAFAWNDKLIPNMPFQINDVAKSTSSDGYFHVGEVPLSENLSLNTTKGDHFNIIVEKGKSEYIFDITQYAEIVICVKENDIALPNKPCDVYYGNSNWHRITDSNGLIMFKLPLECDSSGQLLQPQPLCKVTCSTEVQLQKPMYGGEVLSYNFYFTRIIEQPEPVYVKIRLLDYGGFPLKSLPFELETIKKGKIRLETDSEGYCKVLQEWFSNNENIKISFVISPEYQEANDIHIKKTSYKQ